MSPNKKKLLKTILIAGNSGCGHCGRSKPSDVHQPSSVLTKAKLISIISKKDSKPSCNSSSSSNHKEDSTTSQNSELGESGKDHLKATSKIIDSIAVVKDSSDPYQDFKTSMLQMILEKEMYSEDDLQELLNCYLELNSPFHHGVIIEAFTEIWNEVMVFERLIIKSRKPSFNGDEEGRRRRSNVT